MRERMDREELASERAVLRGEVEHGPNQAARATAAARASLSAGVEAQIAALRQPDARKRLGELATFGALWIAGGVLVMRGLALPPGAAHWALRGVGTLLAALTIHVCLLLLHDGIHHSLFRGRRLNRWASVALGSASLISFSAYQVLHERHHIYLGDPRDPDDYRNYSGNPRIVWAMHYVRLFFGAFVYILAIPMVAYRKGTPRDRRRIVQEYAVLALFYAVLVWTVPGTVLVHAWLLPIIPAGLMVNVRSLAAHGITDAADPFLASRSIEANPVVAFFLRNENYHLEHHLFPEVPSYNLARVHRLVWHRMPRAVGGRSYLGFIARFVRASARMDDRPIGLTTPGAVAAPGGASAAG